MGRLGRETGLRKSGRGAMMPTPDGLVKDARSPGSLHELMKRKSTIAFLLTLPLVTLMIVLVAYPAGSAIYLSMLDRSMTRFVGFRNFAVLFGGDGFWMVLYQISLFAITAVVCKAIIGFAAACCSR
jgi:multiple sugar transport system permease protein